MHNISELEYRRKIYFSSSKSSISLILFSFFAGGKSSILLDVKPWDDETDMKKLEEAVRSVQQEGLTWGACMTFYFHCTLFNRALTDYILAFGY